MATENNGFHKPIPYRRIILALLLIAIIIMQIAAAQIRSFWEDEAVTGRLVSKDFTYLIVNLKAGTNNNPPLYWLAVFLWSKVFGVTELGLRSLSIFWMVITFLLTYKITKDLFDANVALVAVGLLTFSPLVLTYAHNARYYSMAAVLVLLLLFMTYKYILTNKSLFLVFYVLVGTGLLYTIYMGATVLLALNLWWLIQWVRGNRKFSRLVVWALAQGLILLLYTPWVTTLVSTMKQNLPSSFGGSNWLMGIALRVGYLGYAFTVGEFLSPLNPIAWLGILIISGIVLLALWKGKKGKQSLWLPVVILVVEGIISIWFNLIALIPQSFWQNLPNRTFFVYPLFIMILAYGVVQLRGKWRGGALVAVFIVYGVGIFNYFGDRQVIKPILVVPWRKIMTDIQIKSKPDAVVICTNGDFSCSYYQTRYGFKPVSPEKWAKVSVQKPTEVWWIQSNLSNQEKPTGANLKVFKSLQTQYMETGVFNYAPQDSGIARLKTRFLGYLSYQYRVVVYKFVLP